jgi:hypothetical protein
MADDVVGQPGMWSIVSMTLKRVCDPWSSIFGGVTLVNQWRDTTQRMGRKSTKELLSLASFSHILFYHF